MRIFSVILAGIVVTSALADPLLSAHQKALNDLDARLAQLKAEPPAKGVVPPGYLPDYWAARDLALAANKTLFVWVRYRCHSSEIQVPGIHYHASDDEALGLFAGYFNGPAGKTQGVIVSYPEGGKVWFRAMVWDEDVCASNLRRAALSNSSGTVQAPAGRT